MFMMYGVTWYMVVSFKKIYYLYIFRFYVTSDDGYFKTFSDVAVEELLKAPYIEIRGMPFILTLAWIMVTW